MADQAEWWRRRWVRNTGIAAAAAVLLFTILGFFVIPPVARSIAETQAGKALGRRVSIGKIRLNPFALSLTVEKLQVFEADGTTPFVGFGRLYVNAQLSSVYRLAPVVKEIRLESPRVRVVRLKESSDGLADLSAYNFSDILAKLAADDAAAPPPPKTDEPAETPKFSINNVHLLDGQLTFDDQPTGGHHVISELRIGVPFISTLPVDIDTFVVPGLAVRIDGTPFSIDGRTKPFKDSLETTLDLHLNALDLARYQAYVPVPLKFQLVSGVLTTALDLSFVRPSGGDPAVTVTGSIELGKLAVRERGAEPREPAVRLEKLHVKLGKLDLSRMQFHVAAVRLAGLDVRARRLASGTIDLERWAPEPAKPAHAGKKPAPTPAPASASKKNGAGPRFVVDDIHLDGINVNLTDETVRPAFKLAVRDVDIAVKHLSNNPGARADVTVGLRAEPGGTLSQSGTVTLEPLALAGQVKLEGIEPARFSPYYADRIAFDINKGRIALGTSYRVEAKGRATSVLLSDAFVELSEFWLRRRGAKDDFLRLGTLAARKVGVDLDAQTATVGQVESRDVRVRAARDEAGVIDLTTLVVAAPAAKGAAVRPKSEPAADASGGAAATPAAAPEWAVDVARVDLEGWNLRFDDRHVKPRATLVVDGLAVHLRDVSTKPGSRIGFDVRLGLNKTGKIQLTGSAVAQPLAADVQLDLKRIEILPFQPYFRDKANLLITDGALSVKGRAKVDTPRQSPARGAAAPSPRVTFLGDVDIAQFAALDGRKNERLLAWKSFHLGGIDVVSEPLALGIKQVALSDFQARLIIFPDAHFNLQDIAVAEPATGKGKGAGTAAATPRATGAPPAGAVAPSAAAKPAAAGAPGAPAPKITIGEVTLQGGDVTFTDRLIQPNYTTHMTELAGRITGLSAAANTTAEVALRGAIDHSGILTIDGRINPLAKDLFVDLKVDLKEFELPPTSPYAGRYAGYGIDKGKLAISLDYHVAGGKLDAKNRLTLDQFTFGEKVNSPEALKLPVKLAVALLKDRHGVIDIDLPISGSLDDPQFKLGRLILKTLGNLIVKAATAPFSLIAKAFGGGDEQSFVEFSGGQARIEGRAAEKIKAVARALHERPGLSFEVEGQADPQKDPAGLRQELYDRRLRGQKIKAIVEAGGTAPAADTVRVEAAERPRLIDAIYRAETFAKPRKPDGSEKPLPPPEMEKLILANLKVQQDDLRQLALRRANAVKEALVHAAPDAAARVFLVSPRTITPGNRVDLKLKQD